MGDHDSYSDMFKVRRKKRPEHCGTLFSDWSEWAQSVGLVKF